MRFELARISRDFGDFEEVGVVLANRRCDNGESARSVKRDDFLNELSANDGSSRAKVFLPQICLEADERAMGLRSDMDGGVVGNLHTEAVIWKAVLLLLGVDGVERISARIEQHLVGDHHISSKYLRQSEISGGLLGSSDGVGLSEKVGHGRWVQLGHQDLQSNLIRAVLLLIFLLLIGG